MDKFLQIADGETFGSSTSETFDFDVNDKTFTQFMRKILIWD